ncbi:MAG: HupE/UreJ family protein [Vicinamibacterales bacterium]
MVRSGRGLALIAVLLTGVAVSAHEIGTTRVSVTFPVDGTYRAEIVTDASSLLDKLELAGREPRSGASEVEDLRDRLRRHAGLIPRKVTVAFDGVRTDPAMSIEVAPSADVGGVPGATIILTGPRPADARALTWTYGWTFASYALRVQTRDSGEPSTQWLDGGDASAPVSLDALPPPISRLQLAARYLALGFTHILPKGLDHVLFVLGVFLLSRKWKPILMQVSAFTVAHSITLALSIYGLVSVSPSIVEPMIALSIAYIAVENLVLTEMRPWRVGLVFGFGLLHGLGFAGALRDVGLPRSEFVTALLGFNVGVELGQLAVIGGAFLAVGYWYGNRTWYRRRIVMPASACIACMGMFWTIQRMHF